MNYLLFFAFAIFVIIGTSCNNNVKPDETNSNDTIVLNADVAKIQIIYFHGTRRCPSCVAIGDEAGKLVQYDYQKLVDSGDLVFFEINIDEEQNIKLAEKYEIAGSALLVIKTVDGKEEIADLTGDGFKLARNMPDMFREKLKAAIDNLLK